MKRETMLERDWRISSGCGPFGTTRLEIYHATYGCNFRIPALRPVKQENQEVVLSEPTPEWVSLALDDMIREEGSGRHKGILATNRNKLVSISDEIVYDLLEHYEDQIAFGEKTEAILKDERFPKPEDKIAAILCEPTIGNRNNAHELTKAEVKRGLDAACSSGGPLVFILPAFPFKDQNLFRSDLPSSAPDFGEIAMLIHLHCLAMAVNQVFRHDVMWLIISDGTVYEDIFGAEPGSAKRYISALRDWRSRLNIDGSIHFIDLDDLVKRHNEENHAKPEQCFTTVIQKIAEIFHSACKQGDLSFDTIRMNLAKLARGMLWNQNWKNEVQRYGLDTIWQVHLASCEKEKIDSEYHMASDELWEKAMQTAIRYAAFNLASRHTQLLSRFMPYAIRATSHVKPGQIGMPREIGVAPWNGLAVYERHSNTCVRVRSLPLCQIEQPMYVRFRLYGSMFGFGFAKQEAIKCYL